MNKYDQLLQILDKNFGFSNQVSSRFRTLRRGYDDNSGEYYITLQYRARRGTDPVQQKQDAQAKQKQDSAVKKKEVADGKIRRNSKRNIESLLQRINNDASYIVKTGAAAPLDNEVPQI